MAALYLLIANFLTVITDVGNQVFGFLAFRDNSSSAFLGRLVITCGLGGVPTGQTLGYQL